MSHTSVKIFGALTFWTVSVYQASDTWVYNYMCPWKPVEKKQQTLHQTSSSFGLSW